MGSPLLNERKIGQIDDFVEMFVEEEKMSVKNKRQYFDIKSGKNQCDWMKKRGEIRGIVMTLWRFYGDGHCVCHFCVIVRILKRSMNWCKSGLL